MAEIKEDYIENPTKDYEFYKRTDEELMKIYRKFFIEELGYQEDITEEMIENYFNPTDEDERDSNVEYFFEWLIDNVDLRGKLDLQKRLALIFGKIYILTNSNNQAFI